MDTPLTAYWTFGGEPMCLDCLHTENPGIDDDEINGGYSIETDKLPYCPGCNRLLNLHFIGESITTGTQGDSHP